MRFADIAAQHGQWAMGVLGWTPCAFWQACPTDVLLAWRGWCARHGMDSSIATCDRVQLETLLTQFPD